MWTDVSNVGRLDATVVGYSIWRDIPGHCLRRALRRLRAVQTLGWKRARRTELIFNPAVTFSRLDQEHRPGLRGDSVTGALNADTRVGPDTHLHLERASDGEGTRTSTIFILAGQMRLLLS
ncbi:hypothetical protein ACFY6U_37205 [Streptomyces sp. NPDC013157]|uniref:hypothetical protein n=1 Tax=Streptomyces sp. NPDC013157 TaxID=3364861 RepID=UPI0036901DE6